MWPLFFKYWRPKRPLPYYVEYKNKERNWGQHSLGDYCPNLDESHEKYLEALEEAKWQRKKERHRLLKEKGKKVQPLRRGRKPLLYPRKKVYRMDDPKDVARVQRFKWFSPCWRRSPTSPSTPQSRSPLQKRLIYFFPDLLYAPHYPESAPEHGLQKPLYMPHFREPRYVSKEEFCNEMASWAWGACRFPRKKVGQVSHVFYLNDFFFFDCPNFVEEIDWSATSFLPSDLIRLELYRRLQGFETFNDYFRMLKIAPAIMDHVGIKMTHALPSTHRYTGYLKQIGVARVKDFFDSLVHEARGLGLVKDQVHLWDGQFHETWLQKDKKRKEGLPQFFGGTYNHGGSKVGVGVYQSTIVDWNGTCAIPIHCEVIPANKNENPAVRKTIQMAYEKNPAPDYILADRGPSGEDTQDLCATIGARPVVPLRSNVKNGVRKTSNKGHRIYSKYVEHASDELLEKVYNIRTRVEEHYSLNDDVYEMRRLHGCGKELIEIEILLGNCLAVLVPLTAYKIGRPDLMWSPSSFRDQPIHPERLFPRQFRELNNFRWDDDICVSPIRYRKKILEKMKRYQNSEDF